MTNEISKVKIKSSDLEKLYGGFDEISIFIHEYVPTKEELKKMLRNLKKYAIFLLYINDKGVRTDNNEEEHMIIEEIIKQYIVIDYEK